MMMVLKFFLSFWVLLDLNPVFSGYVTQDNLNTPCEYDEDCMTFNSYCKGNTICACKKGYEYDGGSDICFPKEIGLKCKEDYDCSALRNSYCNSESVCSCKGGYVATENKADCLPMSRLTLNCQENVQCRTEHSICDPNSQQCVCENGYHEARDTHECLQNFGLKTICNFTRECYVDEEHHRNSAVTCREDDGYLKKCLCADGFTLKDSRCNKDSGAQALILTGSALLFMWVSLLF